MKKLSVMVGALLAISAFAETPARDDFPETFVARRARENPPTVSDLEKPNEIIAGPISYSGIAVQVLRSDDLAQLFNPGAPERYGFGEDNLVRDPIDGKVSGLKLFAIQF